MLSKAKLKLLHALEMKKRRKELGLFVAEGPKLVGDLWGHFPCQLLVATQEWFAANEALRGAENITVEREELLQVSFLKTPQEVLAIFKQRHDECNLQHPTTALCLALDDVQDPGNLGTVIRLADWFGIEDIYCSLGTVDVYSPKVVQATMGALARVRVHYVSLPQLITALPNVPIYGTFLDGENIYTHRLSEHGLIVMGNEGNGIGAEVAALVNERLYVPHYPTDRSTSESLNVAVATAVVCAEFRRRVL